MYSFYIQYIMLVSYLVSWLLHLKTYDDFTFPPRTEPELSYTYRDPLFIFFENTSNTNFWFKHKLFPNIVLEVVKITEIK